MTCHAKVILLWFFLQYMVKHVSQIALTIFDMLLSEGQHVNFKRQKDAGSDRFKKYF
jgi:hypothetical protein